MIQTNKRAPDGVSASEVAAAVLPDQLLASMSAYAYSAASTDTAGAYVQVVASVSADVKAISLGHQEDGATTIERRKFYIAIGAASSEVNITHKLIAHVGDGNEMGNVIWIPIRIPSGSRISVKVQDGSGSAVGHYLDVGVMGD